MRKAFWTAKGVRQGCLLIVSAKLFTLMLADLDEKLPKRKKWRVEIRGKR